MSCQVNQIFLGEIASIQNYGAFVRIPGCGQQGLIHRSQVIFHCDQNSFQAQSAFYDDMIPGLYQGVSSSHVDDVSEVLQRGERVWCKVIAIGEDGKIGLSMKHVNQGDGTDLDPNGVQQQRDEQNRKLIVSNQRQIIQLQAVLNTTCAKCGTLGHLAKDCFMTPDGKKYELLSETEEEIPLVPPANVKPITEKKHKPKKVKKKKKKLGNKQESDSESDDAKEDSKKKKRKRHSKEHKRKKKPNSSSSNYSESDDSDLKPKSKKRIRDASERHSKKCKRSKTKYLD